MTNRTTPIRWFSTGLLLLVLVLSSGMTATAQEAGIQTASPTPTSEIDNNVSIGGETVSQIATDTPISTDVPGSTTSQDATQETSEDSTPTSTPASDGGIGGEETSGVSTGDGTPIPDLSPTETETVASEASPTPSETPDEVVKAASVGVSVKIYICGTDYAGGDPASDANCGPASAVDVSVSADGNSLGTITTDNSGTATIDTPEGSQITFAEVQPTLPSGYVPNGNGTASVTAESGGSVSIVNIEVQTAGRLQISNGQCPTSGDARTEFIVVGPLAAQAAGLGCEPHGGTSLTVSGPGGTYTAHTDAGGNWIGTLPIGSYTISNSGGSAELDVEAGATTIVLVVDYVPGPKGTLTIQRYDCAQGVEGTTITIDGGPNNDSCLPSNQRVSVSAAGGGAAPLVIDLGDDGATSVDVAAGGYVVTDGPTGASATVDVTEASSVTATINSTILTGVVSASLFWCTSSVSESVNPGAWGNWTKKCSNAGAGLQVTLLDADGNVVSAASTGNNGGLSFSSLTPGRYSLSSAGGCALFANGADARNGFDIVAGGTVEIAVFGCDAPANIPSEPSDPGPVPGSIGEQDGTASDDASSIGDGVTDGFGGAPLANPALHTRYLVANPLANVSTLPATGEGTDPFRDLRLLVLLGMATLATAFAFGLTTERGKRTD